MCTDNAQDEASQRRGKHLSDEIEIKYDEAIPDERHGASPGSQAQAAADAAKEPSAATKPAAAPKNLNTDLMKYMDNSLRSPLCRFVMEFAYSIGDISHAVESSAPVIRQAVIIILKEYIKILKEDNDDALTDDYDGHHSHHLGGQRSHHHKSSSRHSFYIVLPIIWGMLNAIKEGAVRVDRKSALSLSKCVDTLSKYNRNNARCGSRSVAF